MRLPKGKKDKDNKIDMNYVTRVNMNEREKKFDVESSRAICEMVSGWENHKTFN